jgi:hypothetical protein
MSGDLSLLSRRRALKCMAYTHLSKPAEFDQARPIAGDARRHQRLCGETSELTGAQ